MPDHEAFETICHEAASDPKTLRYEEIIDEMIAMYETKNADYGDSFSRTFKRFGPVSAVTRISDKYERICSLMDRPPRVKEEAIRDTLLDMANYCIMTVMEMEGPANEPDWES